MNLEFFLVNIDNYKFNKKNKIVVINMLLPISKFKNNNINTMKIIFLKLFIFITCQHN